MTNGFNKYLNDLFHNFPLGIIFFNPKLEIIHANRSAEEILSYHDGIEGKSLKELKQNTFDENYNKIPYENYPTYKALITGKEQKNHIIGFKNEDEIKWIKVSSYPQFKENELKPFEVYSIFEDITEIKKADAELKRTNEILRMTQTLSKIGSYHIEYPSRKVRYSEGIFKITKLIPGKEYYVIEDYMKLVHPEDKKYVQEQINISKLKKSDFEFEYRIIDVENNVKYIYTIGKPLLDTEGEVCGLFGVIIDITEQKEAYNLLLLSEERFKSIVENSIDGITLIDENGIIIQWNKGQENITGIKSEDAIGKTLWDIQFKVSAEFEKNTENYNRLKSFIQNIHKTGKFEGVGTYQNHLINDIYGNQKLIQSREYPIKTNKGYMIGGILRDITELQRVQDEKNKIMEKLKQANKELEYFVYAVSHDLQEPVRMIKSYANLIDKKYTDKFDEDGRELLHYLSYSAVRMQELIIGLLNYSRLSTRAKEFEVVNCKDILESVLDDLHLKILEENCTIDYDKMPEVKAEPVQMRQLFQNLIQNAIKFRNEEDPRISIKVKDSGDAWEFSIKDNGIGIDENFHERIFDIFQQLHEREKYEGTGVGLTLCKKIVQRHGGKIWVESKLNEGSTFYFTIPKLQQY